MPTLTWNAAGSAALRWLLPAAAVLEVTGCKDPAPVPLPLDADPGLAQILLGAMPWRGQRLALLQLDGDLPGRGPQFVRGEGAIGDADAPPPSRLRAVVCPGMRQGGVDAFALVAVGTPSLMTLRDGDIESVGVDDPLPSFCGSLLRLHGQIHAVPDLDALTRVLEALDGVEV